MIRQIVLKKCIEIMASRPPDFEIGPEGDRYMLRWHLTPWSTYERGSSPKNWFDALKRKAPALYLHEFLHDDEDRALHDHPWASLSWLIKNAYWEVVFYPITIWREIELYVRGEPRPTVKVYRPEGKIAIRGATTAHRVVLNRDADGAPIPAISLFFTGFRVREWGFACPKGWRVWYEFVNARDKGAVGRGCGEG